MLVSILIFFILLLWIYHKLFQWQALINMTQILFMSYGEVLIIIKQWLLFYIVKSSQALTLIISKGDTGSSNDWKNFKKPNFDFGNVELTSWDVKEIMNFIKALYKAGRAKKTNLLRVHPHNPHRFKVNVEHVDLLRKFWDALGEGNSKAMWILKAELSKFTYEYLYPFPLLPNVSRFRITTLAKYHPILKLVRRAREF